MDVAKQETDTNTQSVDTTYSVIQVLPHFTLLRYGGKQCGIYIYRCIAVEIQLPVVETQLHRSGWIHLHHGIDTEIQLENLQDTRARYNLLSAVRSVL